MTITYHGKNYFKLQSGKQQILIDPTDQRSFRGAGLVLNTARPSEIKNPGEEEGPFWIDRQGEYEVQSIKVRGWQNEWDEKKEKERNIFSVNFEGFNFLIMNQITEEPKPEIQEFTKNIDVAIVPGGGSPHLSEEKVARFLRQIEPAIIVPSLWEKNINNLLKELGKDKSAPEEKLVIQKKDVKQGTMEVRCLKP